MLLLAVLAAAVLSGEYVLRMGLIAASAQLWFRRDRPGTRVGMKIGRAPNLLPSATRVSTPPSLVRMALPHTDMGPDSKARMPASCSLCGSPRFPRVC